MRKVQVLADSCSDLSKELLEKYGIDYAKMSTINDSVESPALLTWTDDEVHDFYNIMRGGKRITTAQVSTAEFTEKFEKYLEEGCDIVYIGCSSKQSGSVNTAYVVAKRLLEKYPDAKICCIDSLNASIGEGMLAIEAAIMAAEGKDAETIEKHILSIRKKVNQYVTVHSLDTLHKAGRVTASAAFFGNLMGVKPILIADANGVQTAYKKVKSRAKSLNEIVGLLKENIENPEEQTVYIAHADCGKEEVEVIAEAIKKEINCKDVYVCYIGPIIGASIGPDAIGVWGFGKEVTHSAE